MPRDNITAEELEAIIEQAIERYRHYYLGRGDRVDTDDDSENESASSSDDEMATLPDYLKKNLFFKSEREPVVRGFCLSLWTNAVNFKGDGRFVCPCRAGYYRHPLISCRHLTGKFEGRRALLEHLVDEAPDCIFHQVAKKFLRALWANPGLASAF
jgi:hypothetical protein